MGIHGLDPGKRFSTNMRVGGAGREVEKGINRVIIRFFVATFKSNKKEELYDQGLTYGAHRTNPH